MILIDILSGYVVFLTVTLRFSGDFARDRINEIRPKSDWLNSTSRGLNVAVTRRE